MQPGTHQPLITMELPGPKARAIIETDSQVTSPSLPRAYPLVADHACGCIVTDVDGNRFLDFAAGIAVCATGHCHPRVVRAIQDQAARLIHLCGSDFYYLPYTDLASKLASLAPGPGPWQVFLTNSGAEAVEGALKLARYATGRHHFLAFFGAFHGRTLGALSLTASKTKYRRKFGPLLSGVTHVPYAHCLNCHFHLNYPACHLACLAHIEQDIFTHTVSPDEVAAVIVEPVLGEGGYVTPPPDWLPALRELCNRHGILLIADEVQSGMGRTGKMFAVEHFGVVPDIITAAKGLASGMPLGAIIARSQWMSWEKGAHGSTFGGNPVACAAALETIALLEEGLIENAWQIGAYLLEKLAGIKAEHPALLADVRGLGLMIGVEFQSAQQAHAVAEACFRRGLIVLECGQKAIRLSPPLVVTQAEADTALDILAEALEEME
ncbi:MAG: acetyl ornithine aminotransferase family protein [Anaerolineales bacterium]|nr:acetyl ornithine aminotransferase family protein [Anaerolineales bacterium]